MRRRFTLAAALATLSLAGAAQARKLDRRIVIQRALQQNPQVAAANAEVEAVRAQRRQVTAAHMPMIALDGGVGPSLKATLIPGSEITSVQQQYHGFKSSDLSVAFLGNLSVIQPLFTFGKIALRGEAADHGIRAREAQMRMTRADVAFEAARLYEGLLYARDAHRFFQEMKDWLQKELDTTQDMLERKVKNTSDRDILRIQAALGLADVGIHEAEAGEGEARSGLIAYLGFSQNDTLELADEELGPVGRMPGDYDLLVNMARGHRPEYTALYEGERALDALARAEKAGLWPNLFAMGFVNAVYTPGRDWIETRFVIDPLNHFAPGLLLGLRWELQGSMPLARAAEQRAHADVILHMGEWATEGIPAEVRKWHEDAKRAWKDIETATASSKIAKQWMVTASADYGIGLLDIRELSDAVTSYVTLRTTLFRARFDHNVAMAGLSRAIGNLDTGADVYLGSMLPEGDRK
jgi:outer membrane protein TolC